MSTPMAETQSAPSLREVLAAWLMAGDEAVAGRPVNAYVAFATEFIASHSTAEHGGDCPHVAVPVAVTCSRCVCDDYLAQADGLISGPLAGRLIDPTTQTEAVAAARAEERDRCIAVMAKYADACAKAVETEREQRGDAEVAMALHTIIQRLTPGGRTDG